MIEPKFKIGQEVFCNVDLCRIPNTIGFHKLKITTITIEKVLSQDMQEIKVIYRCEIQDKFRTLMDPYIERNWRGKAKELYVHVFDLNERNLFTEVEAAKIFKDWIGKTDESGG